MPMLNITTKLPRGETVQVYIDGVAREEVQIDVPNKFHLKIVQYRLTAEKNCSKNVILSILPKLLLGGRVSYGKELESPNYAIYEADIELTGDADMKITLHKKGLHYMFEVEIDKNYTETNVICEENNDRENKTQWILSIAPFVIMFLCIACFGLYMIWSSYLSYPNDTPIAIVLLFTCLFGGGAVYVVWQLVRRLK